MAVTVTEDVVRGSGLEITTDGYYVVRCFTIKGLSSTPAATYYLRAYDALAQHDSRLQLGGILQTSQLFVERIKIDPIADTAKDTVRAWVYYRDMSVTRIRVNGALTRSTTRYDKEGKILEVRYDRSRGADMGHDPGTSGGEPDYAEEPVLIPGTIVEWELYQDVSNTGFGTPFEVNDTFQTSLNKATFMGKPKHTWQYLECAGQRFGSTIAGGSNIWLFRHSIQFIGFNVRGIVDTYDPVLIWTEKQTRRPPAGMDPKAGGFPAQKRGNGWRQVELFPEQDFNELNLDSILFT